MKQVIQLDEKGYYVGTTNADESPLERGVYLIPAGAIDVNAPSIPIGKKARWADGWVFEEIDQYKDSDSEPTYAQKRAMEYPPMTDYLDGVVKGNQAQIDAYIAACLAVKEKYPKP